MRNVTKNEVATNTNHLALSANNTIRTRSEDSDDSTTTSYDFNYLAFLIPGAVIPATIGYTSLALTHFAATNSLPKGQFGWYAPVKHVLGTLNILIGGALGIGFEIYRGGRVEYDISSIPFFLFTSGAMFIGQLTSHDYLYKHPGHALKEVLETATFTGLTAIGGGQLLLEYQVT